MQFPSKGGPTSFPLSWSLPAPTLAFSWKPSPTTPVHNKECLLLWLGGFPTPALLRPDPARFSPFAALGAGQAHQELTILQMDLASSENFWEYTSSVSRTRRSTSSRFTFSLRPRNGDWPSIIS